jgi:hypothetical protein
MEETGMLDSARSTQIVNRLVELGNSISTFTTVSGAMLFGFTAAIAGRLLVGPTLGWIAGLLAAAAGYALGRIAAGLLQAILEWMAQTLLLLQESFEAKSG